MHALTLRERRRHPRCSRIAATAIVITSERYGGAFVVEDLSAGGALLVGERHLRLGERVKILLQMVGRAPLSLCAEVLREATGRSGEHVWAVAFRNMPAATEDIIQGQVLRALEGSRDRPSPNVLVVDDSIEIQRALKRDLRALGREVLSVGTPLEAIRLLQDPEANIEVAIIDLFLGCSDGREVLRFLVEEHPDVRRVLMSGQALPWQLGLALPSGQAHAVLTKPWDRQDLFGVLY